MEAAAEATPDEKQEKPQVQRATVTLQEDEPQEQQGTVKAEEDACREQRGTVSVQEDPQFASRKSTRKSVSFDRKSISRRSRRSRHGTIRGSIAWDLACFEDFAQSSGFLVDYITRCCSNSPAAKRRMTDRGHALSLIMFLANQQLQPPTTSPKTSSVVSAVESLRFNSFGQVVLCREKLKDQLMQGIIQESKRCGMFKATPPGAWLRWARHIQKFKRETMCLRVEVHNWIFRRKLLHGSDRSVTECIWERKGRMQEFWSSFHDRAREETTTAVVEEPLYFGMRWEYEQGRQWKHVEQGPGTIAQRLHGRQQSRPETPMTPGLIKGALNSSSSLPSLGKGSKDSRPATAPEALPRTVAPRLRPGSAKAPQLPPISPSRQRYLKECDLRGKIPLPVFFVTGHSKALSAAGKGLVDNELLALAAMVKDMEGIEEVNLYDNALLTDRGLVHMLKQLSSEQAKASLRRLILGCCLKAGPYTLDAMVKLLNSGGVLRTLDLSQVTIAARFQMPLCEAIGRHACLENVNLAEVGFRHHDMTRGCLKALLSSTSVQTLDIGWNCFNGDVFKSLGGFLMSNTSLRALRVANCAATLDTCPAEDFVPPLSRFLEQLSHDTTLTLLDISMNHCDFRTALILEDSLDTHSKLRELVMTHNPLGILGMRSILRLLSREHTGLMVVNTDGCYTGEGNESGGLNGQIFSYTNPGGKYDLQLWRPYHRALLRMLYKMMDIFKMQPDEAFTKISFRKLGGPVSWSHPSKDSIGVWQVPEEGELSLVFSAEQAILKSFGSIIKDADFGEFLDKYYGAMRFSPGVRKQVPLFARWAELEGNATAQQVYITSLSKDFNLTLSHLEYMCKSSKMMISDTIWRLLPCLITSTSAPYFLAGHLFPKLCEFTRTHQKMRNLMAFNVDNPTGHYRLDLANCSDYAVGERLLLLDRWEAAVDKKHNRKDTSNHGNASHIRNEVFQGHSLHASFFSVAEWKIPEYGEFEFDYMSNQRPARTSRVLSDELWESILVETYQAPCEAEDKIAVLRSISHHFYIRASHMRAMIGYFKTETQRADVLIIFYLRIVDMHNAKMFLVRFENRSEVVRLQERLGYASFFPFMQPENAKFNLNLAVFDQRLCASMFVNLSVKEKITNLKEYSYVHADGTEDPMHIGVPRSWADLSSIPKEGVFSAWYMCAPEDRNFGHRKDIAKTYGFIDVEGLTDKEVNWWTGLTEPPEDVINLLEFFISRYDNVGKAFADIDGVVGNGAITYREFMEGLEDMNCRKFDPPASQKAYTGPTKEQRLAAVFRYLDPGGEGTVSREEWGILEQLWNEFDLSIKEFVHFLMMTFGEDLQDAWEALDEDESGELNQKEWIDAVKSIGYFGPAQVVFALLDSSDDGNISYEEFEVLEEYKPARYTRPDEDD